MSADSRPIDHILMNLVLKYEGKIETYMMDNPYWEMTMINNGKNIVIPVNDKECCERFPYVSFFNECINKEYPTYCDNPCFISQMEHLEKDLRTVVTNAEKIAFANWDKDNKRFNLDGMFENTDFPELKDYILSEGKYKFDYDNKESIKAFANHFFDEVQKMNENEIEKEDYEEER